MKNSWRTCFVLLLAALLVCQPQAVLAASVAPPDPKPDVRFGALEAWMEPAAAAAVHVGWDRLLIDWYKYQPEAPEEWVPSADDDARVNTALAAGREMVLLLRGTPAWATDGPERASPPRGLHFPVAANSNLWANFVHRVVKHYKGRVSRYIIWNEPDIAIGDGGAQFNGSIEQYYRMVKIAWLAARQEDPQAKIHLAGLTYWHDAVNGRAPFLQRYLAVAAADASARANNFYFDAATLHIYFRPQSVFDIITMHREFLAKYGLTQPIWLNETNAAPFDDPLLPWPNPFVYVTMQQQGAFVIQAFALALAAGAERAAVYKFAEVSGSLPGFDYYGLYRTDMTARPAVESLRAVTTHFAGVRTTSYVARPTHYIVRLDRGTLVTRVLWARGPQPVSLRLLPTAGAGMAVLYDQFGVRRMQLLADRDGTYKLALPGADCSRPRTDCVVGGAPFLLVEEMRRTPAAAGKPGAALMPANGQPLSSLKRAAHAGRPALRTPQRVVHRRLHARHLLHLTAGAQSGSPARSR